jgi:murein DD-endopeptidase MepM/ murein hydrolase activator NlpD
MNFKSIKVVLFVSAAMLSLNSFSQDLIARQAPVDRKLKSVDSLALQKQIRAEQAAYLTGGLYPSWNNERVHAYGNVDVPESFNIDLRGFCMPTTNTQLTDVYGYRPNRRRMHYGLDIKAYIGDTIRSAFDGKVRIVQYERRGYGKYIVIRHNNGLETVYGHLSKQMVEENQVVKAGEPIALSGNTGRSTGPHLHFETRFLGVAINPAFLFDFERQDVVADNYVFRKTTGSSSTENTARQSMYYKVKPGDTLASIARESGLTVERLCQINRISRRTSLRPGQILRCS